MESDLMRYIDRESLIRAHHKHMRDAGVKKSDKAFMNTVDDLAERILRMEYYPRKVWYIKKAKKDGDIRWIAIPSYEDRIVQHVMADVLSNVYKNIFMPCSYGYRKGRSHTDIEDEIIYHGTRGNLNDVMIADVQDCMGSVLHEPLMNYLKREIDDPVFLEYVKRYLDSRKRKETDNKGIPQGSKLASVLINVYFHYLLDEFLESVITARCKREVQYFRYVDDMIFLAEHSGDLTRIKKWLKQRLAQVKMKLSEEKTKTVSMDEPQSMFEFLGVKYCRRAKDGDYYFADENDLLEEKREYGMYEFHWKSR